MQNRTVPFLFAVLAFLNCSKDNDNDDDVVGQEETIEIPASTVDYGSMDNWVFHPDKTTILSNYNLNVSVVDKNLQIQSIIPITNNSDTNTGIDVFFVHPTILTQNSIPENIPIEDQPELFISGTVMVQGGLLSKYGRMFAPRYRQSTGKTYQDATDKKLQASIIAVSYSDVKAAFLNYLEHYNNGNKIILAGHSQGSYLLALLLRDIFDNDNNLQGKLVTAALGGMGYVFAAKDEYLGGWWQNIPLCTMIEECGCVQNWASFDEGQNIPEINYGLPEFNPYLIKGGLVYREFDQNKDWFLQDFSYYTEQMQPLQYYITPDANYNMGGGNNFIAFNDLYNVRYRREGLQKVVLSVEYAPLPNDKRPNDLADEVLSPNYENWGYHIKDYHIYLWALMQQIDSKIVNCQ